jgi:hypothetical protein
MRIDVFSKDASSRYIRDKKKPRDFFPQRITKSNSIRIHVEMAFPSSIRERFRGGKISSKARKTCIDIIIFCYILQCLKIPSALFVYVILQGQKIFFFE